jgi:two-component sensor histidine kinase
LLQEVHHRIKNKMNTMMSLLSLQAGAMKDPGSVSALTDARRRKQSMMMLYDKLYRSENVRSLSMRAYLLPLIQEIVGNFPNAGMVSIETHVDERILDAKVLSSLGIIVNELLTNAMKYAFVGRNSGTIRVDATLKERHLIAAVHDNGIGLSASFDLLSSVGFGLQLVRLLTQQLHGSIRAEWGEGTTFVLECDV